MMSPIRACGSWRCSSGDYAFAFCTGLTITIPSGVTVSALAFYRVGRVVGLLSDADDNSAVIGIMSEAIGANVTLQGRTLYKDGYWNTLCLPFSLDADQLAASPLAGCTLMKLETTSNLDSEGKLTLNFASATTIEAGKPYIIKWNKAADYSDDPTKYDIVNPAFEGVKISSEEPAAVAFTGGSFVGQYGTFAITADNLNEIILLGSGNIIGYSQTARTLHAFRAHFCIPAGEAGVKAFEINFGNGQPTLIVQPSDMAAGNDAWYDLSGRRLNGKPSRGIYIYNGRKVVVK